MCYSLFFFFWKKFKIEFLEFLGEEKFIIVLFGKDSLILMFVCVVYVVIVCKESVWKSEVLYLLIWRFFLLLECGMCVYVGYLWLFFWLV